MAQACSQEKTYPTAQGDEISDIPEISNMSVQLDKKGQPQESSKEEFQNINNNQDCEKETQYVFNEKAIFEVLQKIKNKKNYQTLNKPLQLVLNIKKYINSMFDLNLSGDIQEISVKQEKNESSYEIKKNSIWDVKFDSQGFYNFLNQLEIQLTLIQQLIECQAYIINCIEKGENVNQNLEKIYQRYIFLNKHQILVTEESHLNFDMFIEINERLHTYLEEYKILFHKMLEILKKKKINETQVFNQKAEIVIFTSKLDSFLQLYPHAIIIDQTDLLCNKKNALELQSFQKRCIQQKKLGSARFISTLQVTQNGYFYLNSFYYFLHGNKAEKDTKYFLTFADESNAFILWNMLEQGFLKKTLKVILPTIQYHQKIYVPQNYTKLTIKEQTRQIRDGSINQINQNPLKPINQGKNRKYKEDPASIFNNKYSNERVKIRVLNYKNLHLKKNVNAKNKANCGCGNCLQNKNKVYKTIAIHIHGGGFVAMSSRSQQIITRKLSQKLKIPVFSIDYKLAPQNPYPEGLNDCWQAYNWIVDNIQDYYNIKPEKIILTGESAGGNLAISICGLAIKYNTKIPTSLYPMYPVIDQNLDRYSTSLTNSLDDVVLNHNLLKLCQKAYLKEKNGLKGDPIADPYISPNRLSDEILSKFPTTRILVGSEDPIIDDCIRFCQKLDQNNVDSQILNYQGLPHGFLAFYPIGQMHDFIDEMKKSV
ncbi:hypothetical protein PPERSA_05059 [Pseudocohnilembus persalinus]|uniref:Alpha/beta hydrolase fold-3 domain-containing protein n=1 Tax=Pseudocohnilembus persalinus TaxID=266149 RepID=A0A0V0QW53_PSEPJ|nr:hypothetical protein PPERSA_05059 [Pseudocohnilembus persalinus]|eukprot:KRX06446.1 hypothetical protein PPERSA_05059 [Pseudocohnilembus persalinus]